MVRNTFHAGLRIHTVYPKMALANHQGEGHRITRQGMGKRLVVVQHVPYPLLLRCQNMRCEGCTLDPLKSTQMVKLNVCDRDIKDEAEKLLRFKVLFL